MNNESSIYFQEGPDKGRVADPNVAQVMADAENKVKNAQDSLDKTTESLEKQGGIPLTEQQKMNLEFVDKVKEKYPDALIKLDSTDGEDLYLVQPKDSNSMGSAFVDLFTKDGYVKVRLSAITPDKDYSKLDWSELLKIAREKKVSATWVNEFPVGYDRVMSPKDLKNVDGSRNNIMVEFVDLKTLDDIDKKVLRTEIELADARGKLRKAEQGKAVEPVDLAKEIFG